MLDKLKWKCLVGCRFLEAAPQTVDKVPKGSLFFVEIVGKEAEKYDIIKARKEGEKMLIKAEEKRNQIQVLCIEDLVPKEHPLRKID